MPAVSHGRFTYRGEPPSPRHLAPPFRRVERCERRLAKSRCSVTRLTRDYSVLRCGPCALGDVGDFGLEAVRVAEEHGVVAGVVVVLGGRVEDFGPEFPEHVVDAVD